MDILLDNNAIDMAREHLKFLVSIRDKVNFYICPTVIEEFASMNAIDLEKYKNLSETQKVTLLDQYKKKTNKFITNFISLAELEPKFVMDKVFVLGRSRLGCATFSDCKLYYKLLNKSKNNVCDAILGQTAFDSNLTLLTEDKRFYKKLKCNNIKVLCFEELKGLF